MMILLSALFAPQQVCFTQPAIALSFNPIPKGGVHTTAYLHVFRVFVFRIRSYVHRYVQVTLKAQELQYIYISPCIQVQQGLVSRIARHHRELNQALTSQPARGGKSQWLVTLLKCRPGAQSIFMPNPPLQTVYLVQSSGSGTYRGTMPSVGGQLGSDGIPPAGAAPPAPDDAGGAPPNPPNAPGLPPKPGGGGLAGGPPGLANIAADVTDTTSVPTNTTNKNAGYPIAVDVDVACCNGTFL